MKPLVVILPNAYRNKTQMDKSIPACLLSALKQRENKNIPVDTGENRAEQVASGSNEVCRKCGLYFANNTTTVDRSYQSS